jgi:hypothetical protein
VGSFSAEDWIVFNLGGRITDCRNHEADTVKVLNFAPRSRQMSWAVDRDIDITTQRSLLHVSITSSNRSEHSLQGSHVFSCLLWGSTTVSRVYSQLSCDLKSYLMSGFDTISMRPIPALFKSIDKSRRRGSNIDFPVSWYSQYPSHVATKRGRLKVPVRVVSVQCERKHCFEEGRYVPHAQVGGNAVLFDTLRGGLNRSSVFYQMLIGVGCPNEEQ